MTSGQPTKSLLRPGQARQLADGAAVLGTRHALRWLGAAAEPFTHPRRRLHDYSLVELFDVKGLRTEGGHNNPGQASHLALQLGADPAAGRKKEPRISDMTFSQLRAELRKVEASLTAS